MNPTDVVALRTLVEKDFSEDPLRLLNSLRGGGRFFYNLLKGGYFTPDEILSLGLSRDELKDLYRKTIESGTYRPYLRLEPIWEHLADPSFAVGALQSYAFFAWCAKELGCLDLVDVDRVAARLAAYQDKEMGLFFVNNSRFRRQAFRSTWAVLFTLQAFDRLDLVDKEACIEGVLGAYRKGRDFAGGFNRDKARSDSAQNDIFYGLEILEILGALDRVEKLGRLKYNLRWTTWMNGQKVEPTILPQNLERWTWQLRLDELQSAGK